MSKTMKKTPAVLLAGLIAVVAAFAVGAFTAQEAYAEVEMNGDGTAAAPYEITSYEDLQEFASIVNGTHPYAPRNAAACGKLTADIDCGGNKDWTPIGLSTEHYIGHFNGDNHIIKGLSNEKSGSNTDGQGLFGYIGKRNTVKGEVKNVGLEGGKIIGETSVGGVAGYINNGGTITNCYNTGAVSGTANNVGGVVGFNNGGTITDCYNTGAESGPVNVGGVAGFNNGGTITSCYYDITFSTVTKAVGNENDTNNVKGLTTSQMTGTTALNNMGGFDDDAWNVKANDIDPESRDYYLYYPHLKGFAYDSSTSAADWPAKAIVNADIPDSFTYNGAAQGLNKITVSQKPVEVPEGKTAEYSRRTDGGWEALSSAPTDPGTYKMTVKDGSKVIDVIVFIILKPGEDSDYSVKYQTADGAPVGEAGAINVGKYKAIVQFTMSGLPRIEKEFQIKPAPLTIKAKDQTFTYNGKTQGEGDTAYADPAEIAEKVTVSGLQGSDEITSLIIDGAESEIGEYKDRITITGFMINGKPEAKDNYNITLLPGTLTITKPQPKPEPQPQTETDKVAPKAMTAKGKNALTIHWRKVCGAQGYDIFFSICGKDTKCKLTKTIRGNKTFSWTKSGLKTKTPYKAYVKGWTMKDGKKKYISKSPTLHLYTANGTNSYTVAKSIKVKKTKVKLKVGKKYKIKAKIIKRDKTKKLMPATHTKQLRYISTNKKIATVNKYGKIKAKAKGSCKIYVYAANGVSKAIKVMVR